MAAGAATSPNRASAVPSAISTMSGYGGANDAESDQVRRSGRTDALLLNARIKGGIAAADVRSEPTRAGHVCMPVKPAMPVPGPRWSCQACRGLTAFDEQSLLDPWFVHSLRLRRVSLIFCVYMYTLRSFVCCVVGLFSLS